MSDAPPTMAGPIDPAKDGDPSTMYLRAGWLLGISLRDDTNAETRTMLEAASRSIVFAAHHLRREASK